MATGTAGSVARKYATQQVHYLRKMVNYNDSGIASGVKMGILPKDSIIVDSTIVVTTAFNAATTNNLLVGTTAGGNNIWATADSAAGSTGYKKVVAATIGTNAGPMSADRDIYVSYTQTGTAATAGVAYVYIGFIVNNDG